MKVTFVRKANTMSKKAGTILVVDDNKSVLGALKMLLGLHFDQVVTLPGPVRLLSVLESQPIDVVLLDMNFDAGVNSGNEGIFWLRKIHEKYPDLPVVLFTAYADIELAVKAVKEGAADFVVKPWENAKLVSTLLSAWRLGQSRNEVRSLKKASATLKQQINQSPVMLIGNSPAMNKVMHTIRKVAKTDANVLITGENGTGKEMVARELHRLSRRSDEILLCVDMGAITETLFESELFGHVRGAFTDAREDRAGKFEAAHKGTLFLDEIGNLSIANQAKLLAAIQNRSITRVGSNRPVPVDIRLICATNRNLDESVSAGTFREDLLYRINTIHIEVPPLRERGDELIELAEYFTLRYTHKYNKPPLSLTSDIKQLLRQYHWPGNVRELEHTIEKAVILCDGSSFRSEDFLFKPLPNTPGFSDTTLDEMELRLIRNTIERFNGNLSAVAAQLGISRQTLYNKIKKYQL